MAKVTIDLGTPTSGGNSGTLLRWTFSSGSYKQLWAAGGSTLGADKTKPYYLVDIYQAAASNYGRLALSTAQTSDTAAELSAAWEDYIGHAMEIRAGDVVIPFWGPNSNANNNKDQIEPYDWNWVGSEGGTQRVVITRNAITAYRALTDTQKAATQLVITDGRYDFFTSLAGDAAGELEATGKVNPAFVYPPTFQEFAVGAPDITSGGQLSWTGLNAQFVAALLDPVQGETFMKAFRILQSRWVDMQVLVQDAAGFSQSLIRHWRGSPLAVSVLAGGMWVTLPGPGAQGSLAPVVDVAPYSWRFATVTELQAFRDSFNIMTSAERNATKVILGFNPPLAFAGGALTGDAAGTLTATGSVEDPDPYRITAEADGDASGVLALTSRIKPAPAMEVGAELTGGAAGVLAATVTVEAAPQPPAPSEDVALMTWYLAVGTGRWCSAPEARTRDGDTWVPMVFTPDAVTRDGEADTVSIAVPGAGSAFRAALVLGAEARLVLTSEVGGTETPVVDWRGEVAGPTETADGGLTFDVALPDAFWPSTPVSRQPWTGAAQVEAHPGDVGFSEGGGHTTWPE